MNIRKKLSLLMLTALIALTGCSTSSGKDAVNNGVSDKNTSTRLNVSQAKLIADVTENAKYLDKSLLANIKGLQDSDKIGVIITLDDEGLLDSFEDDPKGYFDLATYTNGTYAKKLSKSMENAQNEMANKLFEANLISGVKHSYTTLLNGFSAETTYGQYKKLVKMGIASNVAVSEVYSLPQSAEVSTDAVENEVDVYETGIFDSSNVGYTGMNTSVAILDSGFDIHHSVYKNMPDSVVITRDDVAKVIDNTSASSFTNGLGAEDVYINKKIPYAYDYADKDPDVATFDSDHGTHVAGIIGGHDNVITGVAVDTQLVLMKVFGDVNNGAIAEDILAALEDAVILGVDAINLSLGTSCGFSSSSDNEYINEVYKKIEDAGISMIVAASNDYSSGYGGAESNTNKASNPDSASVGSPGTYLTALSVASVSGVKSKYITTKDGYVFFFNEANSSGTEPYNFYEMLEEKVKFEKGKNFELEYVTVPGYGDKVNYAGLDVKGKVALVKRGELDFETKAAVAHSQGAVACIVYNNLGGDIFMSAGDELKIPYCSISKDDGEFLAANKTGTLIFNTSYLAGPFMSDFSSWGPNPDLTLKPEITAHGGTILSAVHGGGYDEISGTSMACPNMTGVIILLRQYIKENFPGLSSKEVLQMANQLSMSTATIILDEHANPYSPRKQGSGLANLREALTTKAFITVDGSDKAKVELYDDPQEKGEYILKFNINNISNETLKYSLSNLTMTESLSTAAPEFVAEMAYMLNPNTSVKVTGDGTITGDEITVNPSGVVKVEYKLTLNDADKQYIRKSFENGMYVEGFAVLTSKNEDKIDLSLPFLAFFGDWTEAPMFDKTYFEVDADEKNKGIDEEDKVKADYFATTPYGTYYYSYVIPLGTYVYEMDESAYDPIAASEEHAAIGYELNTINGITTVYAGLLRNAKKMTTTIVNAQTGEIVYEHVKYDQIKAHYSGGQVPAYDLINITAAELGLKNNVKYTFTMQAELDYKDGGIDSNLNNKFEFSFYVDYEVPLITNADYYAKYDKSAKENRYYVDLYVYDNHYAQSVRPFTLIDGEISMMAEYATPIYSKLGSITKVTMEITDYMDLLQYGSTNYEGSELGVTNGFGFMVDDYALNAGYYLVNLPGTNVTDSKDFIFLDEDGNKTSSYIIDKGQEFDLTKYLTTNDPTFDKDALGQPEFLATLQWKSSNENIVRVKNGKIEGVGAGRANITVTSMNHEGMPISTTINILVMDNAVSYEEDLNSEEAISYAAAFDNNVSLKEIKFTYFDTLKAFIDGPDVSEIGETGERIFLTSKSKISFYPSEKVKLQYEITPWNLDPSRYELIWSSTNPKVATVDEEGVVTAIKEGVANVTLRIKVDGKLSNLMARVSVEVKNEFIIENRVLVAYKGNGGNVVIPNDEGIMYIGPYAFSLYTTDFEIEVSEEDLDAGKTPGGNDTIKSVTIPYRVLEVQKHAFYNCTNLEKVIFEKGPEGDICDIIRQYAFSGCTSLTDINLDHVMIIGEEAFSNCTSLVNVDFKKIYALGKRAFANCDKIEYVDITTLRNLGPEVFVNCTNLKSFKSGEFTNFSTGMFKNTGVEKVELYYNRIADDLFMNCDSLTEVIFHNDVIYVGKNSFRYCDKLASVEFKAGCEFIYDNAFSDNKELKSITLPNSSVEIDSYVFANNPVLTTVKLNTNTLITSNLGSLFANCNELTTFDVASDNANYSTNGNLLCNKEGNTIVLAAPNYQYGEYTIASGISSIASGAFSGIVSLTKVASAAEVLIGDYAFANCENLVEVAIPTNSSKVGAYAFKDCAKLEKISFVLSEINDYAFANTKLSEVILPDGAIVKDGAFSSIKTLTNVTFNGDVTIGAYAFENCTKLANPTFNGKAEIGVKAFANCSTIDTLDINNESSIDAYAFANCSSIKTLNINGVNNIGDYAFVGCSALESVAAANVTSIGEYAFSTENEKAINANNLTEVIFGDSLISIGDYAFYKNAKLINVEIGNGLAELGAYAFANCSKLETVTISSELTKINEATFVEDEMLKEFNATNIDYVGNFAFFNCKSLLEFDADKVTYFGIEAFAYCSKLKTLDLANATKVDKGAFRYCTDLYEVTAPKLAYIDEQAFSMTDLNTFAFSTDISYVAPTAFYANYYLTKFEFNNGTSLVADAKINDYATLLDGVLYTVTNNYKYLLNSYPAGKTDTEYRVLEGTVRIEYCAMAYAKALTKVVLPDTLKSIGNMAMFECSNLTTVEFRSTVAPTLEGTIMDIGVDYTELEIYDILAKYFPFNGVYPLYYAQFKNLIGTVEKLDIVLPSNKDLEGYDNLLYTLYFDTDNATISKYVAKDKYTINYLDCIFLVPAAEDVDLNDKDVIAKARNAYNQLKQDLDDFGYTKEELDALYKNLVEAENAFAKLMTDRVSVKYDYLISTIKSLGNKYSYDKVSQYYEILDLIKLVDKEELKYIDQANVNAFRKGYTEYFNKINEEIDTLKEISKLPTTPVNKVGLAVVSITSGISVCLAFVFRRFWM